MGLQLRLVLGAVLAVFLRSSLRGDWRSVILCSGVMVFRIFPGPLRPVCSGDPAARCPREQRRVLYVCRIYFRTAGQVRIRW